MRTLPLALLACFAAAAASAATRGDRVVLVFHDGRRVPGILEEATADWVTLKVGGGSVGWARSSIKSIEGAAGAPGSEAGSASGADASGGWASGPAPGPGGGGASGAGPGGGGGPAPGSAGGAGPGPSGEGQASGSAGSAGATASGPSFEAVPKPERQAPPREASPRPAPPLSPAPAPGGVLVSRDAFLKELDARREAYKRQPSTPLMDFQFELQEALDRSAHGLPFRATPR